MSFPLPGLSLPAYYPLYFYEYKDIDDVLTRVEIHISSDLPYITEEIASVQGDPVKITWGDDAAIAPIIYGSTIQLSFYSPSDYKYLSLYSSDPEAYKILYYKNSVLKGIWFAVPDQWGEPLTAPPYPVSMEGIDGLANLRNEPFVDDNEDVFEGRKSFLEIIAYILQKTHLNLPFNIAVDYQEMSKSTSVNVFETTYVDVEMYDGMNCAEVLEAILAECRILQRNAEWWIVSNSNFSRTTYNYDRYTFAGASIGSGATANITTGHQLEGTPMMEVHPALKWQVVQQTYGLQKNLLLNPNFDIDAGNLANWIGVGTTPVVKPLNNEGDRYLYVPGVENPSTTENLTKYVYQSFPCKASEESMRLSFRYACVGPEGKWGWMFWRLEVVGANGKTYFAARVEAPTVEATYWKWFDLDEKLITHNELRNQPVKYLNHRVINVERTNSFPEAKIPDNFTKFDITIQEGIPIDGTMYLRLYAARGSAQAGILGTCYAEVELELLQPDRNQYPTARRIKAITNSRNNHVPADIKLPHGDLPSYTGVVQAYKGYLSDANGVPTEGWKRHGDLTAYPYAELIGRLAASRMRLPQQAYRMTVNSMHPGISMVIQDVYNNMRRFVESGITYNDRMNIVEGHWVEIFDVNLDTGIRIEEAFEIDTNQPQRDNRNPAMAWQNTDEMVAIASATTGLPTGRPGFLDEAYFAAIDFEESRVYTLKDPQRPSIGQLYHGFLVGQAIRHNGTEYVLAQADNAVNAQVCGIVSEIIDVHHFRYATDGFVVGGWVAGSEYYLSPSIPGALMILPNPESWNVGEVRMSLGWGTSRGLKVEIDVGDEISYSPLIPGPQGYQGYQGTQGAQGHQGTAGSGVSIKGSVPTVDDLPPAGIDVGDAYMIVSSGHLWVWDGVGWVDAGEIRGPQGPQGYQGFQGFQGTGSQGPQGSQGVQGSPGTGVAIVGSVATYNDLPSVGVAPGEGYITQSDGHLWVYDGAGWVDAGEIRGPQGFQGHQGAQGAQGRRGNQWRWFSGVPSQNGTEITGDFALNQSTWGVYTYSGTSYLLLGNINGPQGVQGAQGVQGIANRWYSGTGIPSGVTGNIDDYYFQTNGDVFRKTGSTSWSFVGNVRGPQGSQGSQGAQGAQGVQGAGSQGPQGYQGFQGPQGSGTQGPQGPQGAQGANGTSGGTTKLYHTIAHNSTQIYNSIRSLATYGADILSIDLVLSNSSGALHTRYSAVLYAAYNNGSPTGVLHVIHSSIGPNININYTLGDYILFAVNNNTGGTIKAAANVSLW